MHTVTLASLILSNTIDCNLVNYYKQLKLPNDPYNLVHGDAIRKISLKDAYTLALLCSRIYIDKEVSAQALTALGYAVRHIKYNIKPLAVCLLQHPHSEMRSQALYCIARLSNSTDSRLLYLSLHTDVSQVSLDAFMCITLFADRADNDPLLLWLDSPECKRHGPDYAARARQHYNHYILRLKP